VASDANEMAPDGAAIADIAAMREGGTVVGRTEAHVGPVSYAGPVYYLQAYGDLDRALSVPLERAITSTGVPLDYAVGFGAVYDDDAGESRGLFGHEASVRYTGEPNHSHVRSGVQYRDGARTWLLFYDGLQHWRPRLILGVWHVQQQQQQ
jgi:hypothetical protein